MMKYQEIYQWGISQLKEADIQEASLDARLLLEEVCQTDRNYLLVHGEEAITTEQEVQYISFITKRKQHIPLQYLLGYQEFMGLRFAVTPDVLIPRQDTETLVEEVLRFLHDGMHILDVCTGSGCILLSLLHYSNNCLGVGCDISGKALSIAERNAQYLKSDARFVKSNLFEKIDGRYEMIVSNPPYIPTQVIPTLMDEVKYHEPVQALDGRQDGLYFYREIINQAGDYLYPGGMLFFEIGCDQADSVSSYMEKAGYSQITVCKDLTGLDRVVWGIYGG